MVEAGWIVPPMQGQKRGLGVSWTPIKDDEFLNSLSLLLARVWGDKCLHVQRARKNSKIQEEPVLTKTKDIPGTFTATSKASEV